MIRNLVAFGCGWTYGNELTNPAHAYPALIAGHYGWTVENLATTVASLEVTLMNFTKWISNSTAEHISESLVIVGLTNENIGNRTRSSSWPEQNYISCVTKFNDLAAEYNINLLQYNVLSSNYKIKLPTLIESSSALEMLVIRDKPRKDPLFKPNKHPNEKGHAIISELLINKIKPVIIN
jgi:lysophospholipase L1-like esterase